MNESDIYNSIKSTTYVLYSLYQKLTNLEIDGKEATKEYEETLRAIEIYTTLEDKYYDMLEELGKKDDDLVLRLNAITALQSHANFGSDKKICDPSYIIFHNFKSEDVVPMRITNKLFEVFLHNRISDENELERRLYDEYEAQRDQYFVDILDSMSKDKDFKAYKNMLIRAKYKVAFINKRRKPRKLESDFFADTAAGLTNATEVSEYAKKMYKLSEKSINSPLNARSILLSSAFIRANLLQMDEVSTEALRLILQTGEALGDIEVHEGKKLFDRIVDYQDEDKKTFRDKGNSLKRKF